MKYKVGDKARVRKDLKVGKAYDDGCLAVSSMKEYRGRPATIADIINGKRYNLDIDNEHYFWTDEMLEPVKDIINYKGKIYDVVKQKDYILGFKTTCNNYDKALFLKEHKEQILDEVEKEYLRDAIKYIIEPTHNEVCGITKVSNPSCTFINIRLDNGDSIPLPTLTNKNMYRGMKPNKEYAVERLGL